MIKSAIGNSGRVRALFTSAALAAAFIAAGCGDNGVAPIDAPPVVDAPPDAPLPPAQLALSPLTRDYGSVTVGQTSPSMSFTVTNTGGSPSGSISAAVMGSGSANFSIETNGCTTLAANATCTVAVSFSPTASGPKTANLVVSGSPGGSVSASIDGTGVALGDLSINPSSNAFGNVVVGATSTTPATFTITNTGGSPTGTLTVTATGTDPGNFTKQSDTCNGQVLAGNATCTITVSFAPTSAGSKSASFTIAGNPGGSVSAAVSGTGLAQAALAINPSLQDFGTTVSGGQSTTQTFTVTNTGGVASGAIANVLAGTDATQFTIVSGNCAGVMLNPNATCNVIVRFNPSSVGGKAAQLNVTGTPGGTASATLLGTGIAPGQISITPSLFTYPQTTVGGMSVSQVFTVANGGGAATSALTTALGGNDPAHFTIVAGSNGCQGVVLQPAGSCTIAIQFTPTTAGAKSANITVTGNPGGTAVAGLNGDAIPGAALSISPASNDFGSVGTGTQTSFVTFTITNTGGQTSGVPTVAVNGPQAGQFNFVSGCSAALAPLGTCTVQVRFSPTINGNAVAALDVSATPGGAVSAGLFGQGVNPAGLINNPTALNFNNAAGGGPGGNGPGGVTLIGETTTRTFTLTNMGTAPTGTITFAMSGTNAAEYTFTHNCTSLPAGMQCTVTVTFTPTAAGTRTASLVASASPGGSVATALSGGALPRLELLTPSANPFDFADTVINTSAAQTVTITVRNNTRITQTLAQATSALFPDDFEIRGGGTCGATLASDTSCTVIVAFEPNTTGDNKSATLTFSIGAGAANQAVQTLTGDGVDSLQIAPVTVNDFMATAVGTASPALSFLVTNPPGSPTTGPIGTSMSNNSFQIVSDGCAGVALAAGASCTIQVRFLPTTVGADQTGTLTITANPGGTTSQALTGDGVNQAALTFNPNTTVAFGNVFSGEIRSLTVVVANPAGSAISGPVQFNHAGVDSGLFTLQPGVAQTGDCVNNTTTLAGGTSCNIRVQFAPTGTAFGAKAATLSVSASPGTTVSKTIALTGTSVSTISVSPDPFDFGNVNIGTSNNQMFTVSNNSNLPVTITSTMIDNTSQTSVISNNCTTIAVGGTCSFTVLYAVSMSGPIVRVVNVVSANGAQAVDITGNGNTVPNLEWTEAFSVVGPYDLGSAVAGGNADSRTFTLRNNGQATSSTITVMLTDPLNYSLTSNNCGAALAGGATCTVTVRFNPAPGSMGDLTSQLAVMTTGDTVTPINLTGRAVASGGLVITPPALTFPDTVVGLTSASQTITVQNTSGSAQTFSGLVPANFVLVSQTCAASIPAGSNCTATFAFQPISTGFKQGQAIIVVGPGQPYAVLRGTGLAPANITVVADPANPAFPAGTAVTASSTQTLILTNTGEVPSGTITQSVIGGADPSMFSKSGCTGVLAAGASCSLVMTFSPTSVGAKSASFTIGATPGLATQTINLNAIGVTNATIGLTPTAQQNAGSRAVGAIDPAGTVYTITNGGAVASGNLTVVLSNTTDYAIDAAFVGVPSTCVLGAPLAAGASCQVRVKFNPMTLGNGLTTTVTASANPGGSFGGSITGNGTSAVTVAPATAAFGMVGAGGTSTPITVTFTNNAAVATGLLYTDLGGTNETQFSIVTDNCAGKTLTELGGATPSCTIDVVFTPTAAAGTGARTATLTVSGTPGNSATSTLTGTAN